MAKENHSDKNSDSNNQKSMAFEENTVSSLRTQKKPLKKLKNPMNIRMFYGNEMISLNKVLYFCDIMTTLIKARES